jgi:hypothetical protein
MDPVATGVLLAMANTVVIAVGLGTAFSTRDIAGPIMIFGLIPGMLIGAFDGGLAAWTTRFPRWVRLLVLTPIPVGFVWVMATALRLGSIGDAACIPTFVAVLILEKSSRAEVLVPSARVT